MKRALSDVAAFVVFTFCVAAAPALADGDSIAGFIPGVGLMHAAVSSISARRYAGIVRQDMDYSCGAAAVATILKYAYGIDESEWSVISGMLEVSDPATVRAKGFSLLDVKHYVESIGMHGVGYRLTLDNLFEVKVPAIVLMNVEGYDHFVVLRKAAPDYVYVADPLLGNRMLATSDFAKSWDGIMFVIAAPSYNSGNALVNVRHPLNAELGANIPAEAQVLANAELLTIYIPAMNRL